jgi:hypothetical protein
MKKTYSDAEADPYIIEDSYGGGIQLIAPNTICFADQGDIEMLRDQLTEAMELYEERVEAIEEDEL